MRTLILTLSFVTISSGLLGTPQRRSRDLIVLIESCHYDEEKCSVERVAAFIKAGADVNARSDGDGLPVLQLALANQLSPNVIKLLVKAGADVNATDIFGNTSLISLNNQSHKASEWAEVLLNAGAEVNAANNDGWTALMLAAGGQNSALVRTLLRSGANVDVKNRSGDTALAIIEKRTEENKRHGYSFPANAEILQMLRGAQESAPVAKTGVKRLEIPYIRKNVCPGEGCKYGEWISEKATPVYGKEGDTSVRLFTLKPDEIFTAIRGNVHVTKLGVVLVTADVSVTENTGSRKLDVKKGEKIFVLTEYGEGLVDVWHDGEVYQVSEFWSSPGSFVRDAKGVLTEYSQSEWWVFIKTRGGRFGWIRR